MLIPGNDRLSTRAMNYIVDGIVARAENGFLDEIDFELIDELHISAQVEDVLYCRAGDCETVTELWEKLYPEVEAKKLIFEKE